jgi:hypothetical protein
MTKARLDGLYMLLLGSVTFILLGSVLGINSPCDMVDFRGQYYPARCLMQHCDPYNESEALRIAQAEGGVRPWDTAKASHFGRYIYFPSAFSFTVPIALLPWGLARILWMALIFASLIFAAFLVWTLSADSAPVVSGMLAGFLLANSELLVVTGNMAGIVVALCLVGVWCFVQDRFAPAGIFCLAASLALKPHDAGLVWLYFLLSGGVFRKRALQTLFAAVVLSLPGILWVGHVSPAWIQEMHANVLAFSRHGGLSDPDLTSTGTIGIGLVVSLQTVISAFWHDPRIYDAITYLLCAPLLLVWAFVTLRARPSHANAWLALASIAALTMLPIYHRQNDTKLLLLTIPACAMLWAESGRIGRLALLVTAAGFLMTGDLPGVVVFSLNRSLHLDATGWGRQMVLAFEVFPAPITLLAIGVFFLWVYARRNLADVPIPTP